MSGKGCFLLQKMVDALLTLKTSPPPLLFQVTSAGAVVAPQARVADLRMQPFPRMLPTSQVVLRYVVEVYDVEEVVLRLREWCILRKTSSHLRAMSELRRPLRRHVVSAMTKMTSSMAVTTTTTAPRVKEATATMVRMRQNAVKTSLQLSLPLIGDKWPAKVLTRSALPCPILPSNSVVRVLHISALNCLPFQGKNSAEAAVGPISTPT
jgi:hypothetical protein